MAGAQQKTVTVTQMRNDGSPDCGGMEKAHNQMAQLTELQVEPQNVGWRRRQGPWGCPTLEFGRSTLCFRTCPAKNQVV